MAKGDVTLETTEQIIDISVTSLDEEELPVNISSAKIATPEEIPGVRRYYQLKVQTKPDYIPSMSGKKYETVNTQVECEETLNPYAHVFLCQ